MSSRKRNLDKDYIIDSDEDEIENESEKEDIYEESSNDDSDTEDETVDAKRIRLAREYLDKIKSAEDEDEQTSTSYESSSDEEDEIGKKLAKDRLVQQGSYDMKIAEKITCSEDFNTLQYLSKNAHDLSTTCVDLHASGSHAYSASKDHSVVMWDVERACVNGILLPSWKKKQKLGSVDNGVNGENDKPRNKGEVLAVVSSDDGRYVATGGRDALVKIFDVRLIDRSCNEKALVHTFKGHKEAITSLAFRNQTLQLFSGSDDRTVRHYNLEQNAYIETLYGHQQGVTSISCHHKDTPITTSRDRTVRAWKLTQETHFIYRGGKSMTAADCGSVVNNSWFMTGHDNGCVHLWCLDRKKPVGAGWHEEGKEVVSCDVFGGSDFGVSGSYDGFLKLWKLRTGRTSAERGIDSIGSIPVKGYVNGIAIGPKAKFCLVATGQEHRLGRWNRVKGAKNRIGIIPLRSNTSDQN